MKTHRSFPILCLTFLAAVSFSLQSAVGDTINPPLGRLAIVSDGNSPDPDDIGAKAVALALLKTSGMQNRLVHASNSCDLVRAASISEADELRRQGDMQDSCDGVVLNWGAFTNVAMFFNCRTQQAAAVDDLKNAINASSAGDPLWIIEAGEPDIIGYALQAADPAKIPFVHVVSHNAANDDSGDFFTWAQILAFGVQEHQIGDQNVNLQTAISPWSWAYQHPDAGIAFLWDRLKFAEQDGVVAFQTNKFDCSDAGMTYWWLTGADSGGNNLATTSDIRNLLLLGSPPITGTLPGLASDNDVRFDGGGVTVSGTQLIPGTSGGAPGFNRSSVMVFELPDLGAVAAPFTSAALTFEYASKDGTPPVVDLYGLPARGGDSVLSPDDYYTGTDDTTAGVVKLQENILTTTVTPGVITTRCANGSALRDYLNTQYDSGAGIGSKVFIRFSTETVPASSSQRYRITSADGAEAGRPRIDFTTTSTPPTGVIANDDFNAYTAGGANLAGNGLSSFGWAGPWGTPGTNTSSNTTAVLNDDAGDNKLDIALSTTTANYAAGRVLRAPLTTTFYAAYTVQYTGGDFAGNNTISMVLSDLTSNSPGTSNAVTNNVLNFGLRSSTNTADLSNPTYNGSDEFFYVRAGSGGITEALGYTNASTAGGVSASTINSGTAFRLVAKLTYNNSTSSFDQIDMWLDPTGDTEPASNASYNIATNPVTGTGGSTGTVPKGIAAVHSIYFRQGGNETTDSYRIDDLVIGSTWQAVVPGSASGFAGWITGTFANGNTVPEGLRGPNDDPDADGIRNLVEYAVAGLDPTVGNGSAGSLTGTTISFSKRQPLATDITYTIEESDDLGDPDPWLPVTPGVNNDTTISYTIPPGVSKRFARLKVLQP